MSSFWSGVPKSRRGILHTVAGVGLRLIIETDVDALVDDRLPGLRESFAKLGKVCAAIG